MHVIIVGAGIIGVTTAHYLNAAGCEVTVLERNSGVAQEASFGNAGVIAPGSVTPWAAPGMPRKVLSYLLKSDAPVVMRASLDPALWGWVGRWLRECDLARYRRNRERMQRLAFYSRVQLHVLREALELRYEQSQGYMQLFRAPRDWTMAQTGIDILKAGGVAHEILDAGQCRAREPGLSDCEITAGLYLPDDESGNCPLFAKQLKDIGVKAGVRYRFGVEVASVESTSAGAIAHTATEHLPGDALVLAAGVESRGLLRKLGVRVPLYPVRGYSATVPVKEPTFAPQRAIMDEAYKVAITRMGNRIRIAGTAELGRPEGAMNQAALATLIKVARDWFPGAANYQQATYWSGLRPMLPDGPPLLGAMRKPHLWLNLGHGSTGWAMACGSARVLCDLITGRTPEIDLEGLTLARYHLA
jgi:D-amino-acid dehydrogenase